ncbi:hypothetical protein EON79_23290, partial [bacterium]
RFGRAWDSPPGESLSLSVAVPMPPDPRAAPFVGMSLAVRVAERYGVGVQWPNDVTFGGRKLAGILIEGVEIAGTRRLIVGIGVNIGQVRFPAAIRERATSLQIALGFDRDWREEAQALYDLARLPSPPDFATLAPLWSHYDETPGKRYRAPGGPVEIANGVDADGRLLLHGAPAGITVAEAYFGTDGLP